MTRSGISVVMSSLWACAEAESLLQHEYEEIYIHTKVAIVDDAAFTAGSTNLNLRSMALDSELNVLSTASEIACDLRQKLFLQCTGSAGPGLFADMKETYYLWVSLQSDNDEKKKRGQPLISELLPFHVNRKASSSLI